MKRLIKIFSLTLVLVMFIVTLASCAAPNQDPQKAQRALEKKGYEATLIDGAIAANQYKGCESYIVAKDESKDTVLLVYYFRDKSYAKEAWESLNEETAKEALDVSEDTKIVMKNSGKIIYFGIKDAVKAAK